MLLRPPGGNSDQRFAFSRQCKCFPRTILAMLPLQVRLLLPSAISRPQLCSEARIRGRGIGGVRGVGDGSGAVSKVIFVPVRRCREPLTECLDHCLPTFVEPQHIYVRKSKQQNPPNKNEVMHVAQFDHHPNC